MTIDATITDVEWNADGTATIVLNGTARVQVENPPAEFAACIGTHVTGTKGYLCVSGKKWAEAVGKNRLRLVRKR